ncbi:MAG: beta-ketoacyl-[acyl-carrier-protein] synthase II, partial [Gemmatimonadota bacterium]
AAGAIEAIVSALVIRHGIIPPTINLTTPDPECDLDCTANTAVRREVHAVISNSSGFGGHNASLALRRLVG